MKKTKQLPSSLVDDTFMLIDFDDIQIPANLKIEIDKEVFRELLPIDQSWSQIFYSHEFEGRGSEISFSQIVNKPLDQSVENFLNKERISDLESNFREEFLAELENSDFEFGYFNEADKFIRDQMDINSSVTKEWLNKMFLEYFNNSKILEGIIRIISNMKREEIFPQGQVMALAALSHRDVVIKECAIRSFEYWGGKDSIEILENIVTGIKWLDDYIRDVINDIKEEEYVSTNEKN